MIEPPGMPLLVYSAALRSLSAAAFFIVVLAYPPDLAHSATSGVPAVANSYFVPQAGPVATPSEGTLATRFFRACPNNDGGSSLFNNARIKVVLLDLNGNPVPGVDPADICILFNGGTAAQGFGGIGADSIIANTAWNFDPVCPDVRCITADGPTDANGVTYITFAGATPGSPGVATRDPNRKWGHYDSVLPVYVLGFQIQGRLTSGSAIGSYALQIKNADVTDGLEAESNAGEAVTVADLESVFYAVGSGFGPVTYWLDFDGNGIVGASDVNFVLAHFNHDCDTPNSP